MKHAALIAAALGLLATPVERSRRYSGPTTQDVASAKALAKKQRIRTEIRARRAQQKELAK